jgi:hypothetical protein
MAILRWSQESAVEWRYIGNHPAKAVTGDG